MKIHQVYVQMSNEPGVLRQVSRILADNGHNILSVSLAESTDFGVLRMLIQDWQTATQVLCQAGFDAGVNELLAVEVPDRPGGLAEVLDKIASPDLNVEYIYAYTDSKHNKAVILFRFDNTDQAEMRLKNAGVAMVSEQQLFGKSTADN